MKRVLSSVTGPTSPRLTDPLAIHFAFDAARTVHDALDPFSPEGDRRDVTRVVARFIRQARVRHVLPRGESPETLPPCLQRRPPPRTLLTGPVLRGPLFPLCFGGGQVDYGSDLEQHLSFLVDCRRAFSNMPAVQEQLVHTANWLAMETLRIVRGRHTARTARPCTHTLATAAAAPIGGSSVCVCPIRRPPIVAPIAAPVAAPIGAGGVREGVRGVHADHDAEPARRRAPRAAVRRVRARSAAQLPAAAHGRAPPQRHHGPRRVLRAQRGAQRTPAPPPQTRPKRRRWTDA